MIQLLTSFHHTDYLNSLTRLLDVQSPHESDFAGSESWLFAAEDSISLLQATVKRIKDAQS
jgi:hypothetical protein